MRPTLVNGEVSKSRSAADRLDPAAVEDTLRHIRNRSPQESLGLKDESGLLRAFIQATVVTLILFAALTLVPYGLNKLFPPEVAANNKPAATEGTNAAPTPQPAPATTPDKPAAKKNDAPDVAKTPPKKDFQDKLGESGTKDVKPSVNPLDKKEDDLLKDLK